MFVCARAPGAFSGGPLCGISYPNAAFGMYRISCSDSRLRLVLHLRYSRQITNVSMASTTTTIVATIDPIRTRLSDARLVPGIEVLAKDSVGFTLVTLGLCSVPLTEGPDWMTLEMDLLMVAKSVG